MKRQRPIARNRGRAPGHDDKASGKIRSREKKQRRALFTLLTAFFVAGGINLLADITQRFFSGGTDRTSIIRNFVQVPLYVLQGVLALLAGGSLVEPGRVWVEKLLKQIGLYRNYGGRKSLLISVVACGLLVAIRLLLPFFASYYNDWGTQALLRNDLTASILNYQRAISLNPDYAEAHYGLASVYDRMQRYDEAISEYNRAIQLKYQFGQPRNNLARLYLLRGKDRADFEKALSLINEELERSPSDEQLLYSLYKNLGWASFRLENYSRAEAQLRQAILLRDKGDADKGAAAHCLLGYTLEAQQKPGAEDEWDDCVTFARGQNDVEAAWVEHARTRLERGAGL